MRQDIPCLLNMPTCCEFMQVLYLFLDDYSAFRATSKKTEREKNSMVHFVRCHRSFLIFIEYWTKLKFSAPIIYSRCIKAISAIYLSYNRPIFSPRTTYRVSTFDLTYFVLLKVYKNTYKCTSVLCFLVDSKENICKL